MRLPESSPWQYLLGLSSLCVAYLLAVGNGMAIEVEHDQARSWFHLLATISASAGVFLLWLALTELSKDRPVRAQCKLKEICGSGDA
jgi:hypothetical protein